MERQNAGLIGEPAAVTIDVTATVVVAVPSQDQCAAGFAYDLARLIGFVSKFHPNIELHLVMTRGTLIADQRHTLVKEAIARKATHILWLDSDMRFPKDTLSRFLAFNQPIIAANYATRRQPILPTAERVDLGLCFMAPGAQALVSVDRVGMGCMLVQMAVYEKLTAPWFLIGFNPSSGSYVGEDVYFCRQAKKAGYDVVVDPVLSQDIKHLGEFGYTLTHANVTMERQEREREIAALAAEPQGAHQNGSSPD